MGRTRLERLLNSQAVVTALAPGVLLVVVAIVASFTGMTVVETVAQLAALTALVAGGPLAYSKVYSKETHQAETDAAHVQGQNAGRTAGAEQERAEAEAQSKRNDEMWQQWESTGGAHEPEQGDLTGW